MKRKDIDYDSYVKYFEFFDGNDFPLDDSDDTLEESQQEFYRRLDERWERKKELY